MMPDSYTLYDVIDGTWPAAAFQTVGAFKMVDAAILRLGRMFQE